MSRGFAARARVVIAAFAVTTTPMTAAAEVKEYQVRRMLMLKTECTVTGLDLSVKDGKDRFYASCENVSHYPDGVEILCPDTEDERECRIVTQKREFRHLHHLKPADQDER